MSVIDAEVLPARCASINDSFSFGEPSIEDPVPLSESQAVEGGWVVRLRTVITSTRSSVSELIEKSTPTDPSQDGSSWYAAVFLVVNAALGAGLLNFPQAFDQAGGILVACLVQIVLLAFAVAALVILAHCSDANKCSTYQEVVLGMCGKIAQSLCAVCVTLYCYGTCITFLIIIGDQFERVLASWYGPTFCHYWYMTRNFTMVVSSVILILPFCFPRRIDFLKYASSLGVVAVMYVDFLIIYKFYEGKFTPGQIKTKPDAWTDVFLVIPAICFGYQCHVSAVPVYSCLKDRRVTIFLRTLIVAMAVCIITYTVAATFGYLTFGSLVASDVLESYDAKDPIVLVAVIAFLAKTFTTYPILLFCGRTAIDDLYLQLWKIPPQLALRGEVWRRIIIAITWFVTSVFLAAVIPNIGLVIQYLGSLAAIFIFIFPGLCLLRLTLKRDNKLLLLRSNLLIVASGLFLSVGALIFGLVFTQSIMEDIGSVQKPEDIKLCQ